MDTIEVGGRSYVLGFFDEKAQRVTSADKEYHKPYGVVQKYLAQKKAVHEEALKRYELPKPAWLVEAHEEAAAFIGSIGLSAQPTLHYMEREYDPDEEEPMHSYEYDACHYPIPNAVYVFQGPAERKYARYGAKVIKHTMVHELTHSTNASPIPFGLSRFPDGTTRWLSRDGMVIYCEDGFRGQFLEEAFAEYVAGLWQRRSKMPECSLTSLTSKNTPPKRLPSHYQIRGKVSGPDGYSLELLGWAAERKGAIEAEDFLAGCIASRRDATNAEGLRTIARTINAVEPGLYRYLQEVNYSIANWKRAFNRIYAAVTT